MSRRSASRIANRFEGMREFVGCVKELGAKYSTWKVFEDFLAMSSISISNAIMPSQEREQQYLDIVKQYDKDELDMFPKMFAVLVRSLESEVESGHLSDVLGSVFHELELHNKYRGQFFTPQHICDFMGAVTCPPDRESAKAELEKLGYFEVSEPCVGSGAMVLGFAKAMKNVGLNYCNDMCVTAVDIDIKCVYMAYIQLSLYGIPAVVVHGDSLCMKEWSHWFTPIYVLNMWEYRRKVKREQAPCEPVAPVPTFNTTKTGQLTFF